MQIGPAVSPEYKTSQTTDDRRQTDRQTDRRDAVTKARPIVRSAKNVLCTCIFLYADDIILMAPSVEGLQRLLTACEDELITLDMKINVKKNSVVCIRFGARYDHEYANLRLRSGDLLKWTVSTVSRIYLASARSFKCSFDVARATFYRAFNSIFEKSVDLQLRPLF